MVQLFSKYWWTFAVRGGAAVLCGLVILSWAGSSLDILVLSFGIFSLLQGILSVIPGFSELGGRIYFLLIEGVVGILAGVLTFLGPGIGRIWWPGMATMTLLLFIAFWALLSGIAQLIGSLRLAGEIKGKTAVTLSGLVCLLFGVVLLFRSGLGATGNASVIGIGVIVYGVLWLFVGLKARKGCSGP
jgi:uncharacterized membrane protein HdeD (DUF308 family)